jgi:serine/threonine-protein kinase
MSGLSPGTRLGAYEILAELGRGGMGEVYRARDGKLDRDVALKILPDVFAGDPDRVARFEREAKTLASLNHPNIAHIYDAGSFERGAYLAMELVEGQDLSELIGNGALPLEDALTIARQIATALEAAHEQGVIHRDLKPANVKVRADGMVKVLDFGLAKAIDRTLDSGPGILDPMNSPTLTARMTQMGVILGTAAYMAPEQAKGKPVDKRADIFSFGVVLYEMLTGRSLFVAETIPETLAHVMTRPVDLTTLPETTPRRVRELLGRCLEKDPRRRLRDIGEARLVLEDPAIATPDTDAQPGAGAFDSARAASAPPIPRWQRLLPWALTAASLGAAVVLWAPWRTATVVPNVQARFFYTLPEGVEFTRTGRQNLALSPDGTMIAFTANSQIYIRRMGELEAQPLRGSDIDPRDLVFSPDSQSIAFATTESGGTGVGLGLVKKIAVTGGAPVTICETTPTFGLHWSGGRIVSSQGQRILSVADTGGTVEALVEATEDSNEQMARPQVVNGGKDLIYSVRQPGTLFNDGQIVIQPIGGGARRVLVHGGADGRLVSSGHLLWVRDNTLFAQPASASAQLSGGPVPVVEGVDSTAATGAGKFAVSDNGMIAFLSGTGDPVSDLVWVDREGREEKSGAPSRAYTYPRISPDGTRVAAGASDGEQDIWIWDFARKTMSRLTSGLDQDNYPVWTPESRQVLYRITEGAQGDIFRRMADGTGAAEQVTTTPRTFDTPFQVLKDLRVLALSADGGASFLYVHTPGGDGIATPLIPGSSRQVGSAEISPDGRWIAYQSPEGSTVDEIHVRPFPNAGGGHWQISSGGGRIPMWSRDGKELFFRTIDRSRLMTVPVQATPGRPDFVYGTPAQALDTSRWGGAIVGRPFDISADGRRFLAIIPVTANSTERPTITVITHWFDELRARAGGK